MRRLSPDPIVLVAALAHIAPGVTVRAATDAGERFLVSAHDPRALMTPCELRSCLLARSRPGVPCLRDTIVELEVVSGLIDLGAGVFQRSHPSEPDERWFATALGPDHVSTLALTCPAELEPGMHVTIAPDAELGVCIVVVRADPGHGCRLDAAAFWLFGTCLIDELERSVCGVDR